MGSGTPVTPSPLKIQAYDLLCYLFGNVATVVLSAYLLKRKLCLYTFVSWLVS